MNIAIFGGSFDPPHIGHIKIVEKALKKLDIEKLFIVPNFLSPFKKKHSADAITRYKWLKRIFKEDKKVEVLKYEIEQKKAVPTIQTVYHLYKKYPIKKLYLIIGEDNLQSLDKWYRFDELKKLVIFVVATRKERKIPKELINLDICVNISSTELRKNPKEEFLHPAVSKEIITYYKNGDKKDING